MKNDQSFNISCSFKTNLTQLSQLEQHSRNTGLSKSHIIRTAIELFASKIAKKAGNTSNTDNFDVSLSCDDDLLSADMFGTVSDDKDGAQW